MKFDGSFCLLILLGLAGVARAEFAALPGQAVSLRTTAGEVVTGTLARVEPDGLVVDSPRGIRKVFYGELPSGLRMVYGYNAKADEEFRRQKEEQRAAMVDLVLAQKQRDEAAARQRMEERAVATLRGTGLTVTLTISRAVTGGYLCAREATVEKTVTEMEKDPTDLLKTRLRPVARRVTEPMTFSDEIVVAGLPAGLAEGDTWSGEIWPYGAATVPSETGAAHAVERYAGDPLLVVRNPPLP